MDVPFENDIPTMSRGELEALVNNWLWEIPLEFLPSDEQVLKAIELISLRDDAAKCLVIIANCREYISPSPR